MAENKGLLSLAEIRAELQQLCQQNKSGRLVVLANSNRFVSFDLSEGRIVSVNYASYKGAEALLQIAENVTSGRPTFMASTDPKDETDTLPEMDEIWSLLGAGSSSALSGSAPSVSEPAAVGAAAMSEQDKAILINLLSAEIGPVASILAQDVLGQATSIEQAINELGAKIDDSRQASEFIAKASKQLNV